MALLGGSSWARVCTTIRADETDARTRMVHKAVPSGFAGARSPMRLDLLRHAKYGVMPLVSTQRRRGSVACGTSVTQSCRRLANDNGKDEPSVCVLTVSAIALLASSEVDIAAAYEGIGVPTEDATPLQNAFGAAFTIFCGWYFTRVLRKRGKRAKEFRVANKVDRQEQERIQAEEMEQAKKLSALQAFVGGLTGIGISVVLYQFATSIQTFFDERSVPESYTIRQISTTVRTIVEGLAYLATFVYAANGTGLLALSIRKLLDGDAGKGVAEGPVNTISTSTMMAPASSTPPSNVDRAISEIGEVDDEVTQDK